MKCVHGFNEHPVTMEAIAHLAHCSVDDPAAVIAAARAMLGSVAGTESFTEHAESLLERALLMTDNAQPGLGLHVANIGIACSSAFRTLALESPVGKQLLLRCMHGAAEHAGLALRNLHMMFVVRPFEMTAFLGAQDEATLRAFAHLVIGCADPRSITDDRTHDLETIFMRQIRVFTARFVSATGARPLRDAMSSAATGWLECPHPIEG